VDFDVEVSSGDESVCDDVDVIVGVFVDCET